MCFGQGCFVGEKRRLKETVAEEIVCVGCWGGLFSDGVMGEEFAGLLTRVRDTRGNS